ncbi:substrate-binding domain-containing protein [Alicyclobacillus fastidiosus]|uniref:substrate-binding domain-containing protein n=1 Tax=Alicyclobacillus fastidiosus TaxID=392011 RepID=UPI0023E993B3|nr:hypothetical protein GCM10025859_06260 [Alicyclobacillus fastidiosus]
MVQEVVDISKRIPVVLINGDLPNHTFYRVSTDEYLGAQLGVQHLIDLGHENIGFIGGRNGTSTTDVKVNAFRDTMRKNGLSFREEWVLYDDFTITSGKILMEKLLNMYCKPSAVCCVNDFASVGAIKTAIKYGLRIPEDMSIMGYDDTILSTSMIPELTTISQNSVELGKIAVEILRALINGEEVAQHTIIQPKLVRRQSTSINCVHHR